MLLKFATIIVGRLENSGLIPAHEYGKDKITSTKALLLTIWYLSNTETFRQVSDRFDVSLSSAHRCLLRVLKFFLSLRIEYIKWPTMNEYREISVGFRMKQGIDGIIGAIDGCHVRIRRPQEHQEAYVNRHKYCSVLIQGVVDHRKRFLDVYCGEPGSIHDARLLRKSNIYSKAQDNPQFFGENFLLGDSAYPSLRWLVPPFKDNGALSANQKIFNFKHSSSRIVVEHTFGLLKGRFRRLHYLDNLNINTAVQIIMVSCILHNICQMYKDNTPIELYNVQDQVDNTPEAWADFIVCNSRREEVFARMFPE